jgi:hypothetical protein
VGLLGGGSGELLSQLLVVERVSLGQRVLSGDEWHWKMLGSCLDFLSIDRMRWTAMGFVAAALGDAAVARRGVLLRDLQSR